MLALLVAAGVLGGHVYAARVEAGGAQVAVWRYAAAGGRRGPPVVLFGELGFDRSVFDLRGSGLAPALQARGREVFVLEWRGTGRSTAPLPGLGGLDALFGGDAPAALEAALAAVNAPCAQLVGFGLGGAAAYLLAEKACAVVAIAVPASYEVPNLAVRRLVNAVHAAAAQVNSVHFPDAQVNAVHFGPPLPLARWATFPSPLGGRGDLFSLLFTSADARLRGALATAAPELLSGVARWMEQGDLDVGPGPLAGPRRLSAAISALRVPLLVVAAPRDNLVHLEHALALKAPHDAIVLSRIEGFSEDAGHLALQAPWAARELFPEIASWLASH